MSLNFPCPYVARSCLQPEHTHSKNQCLPIQLIPKSTRNKMRTGLSTIGWEGLNIGVKKKYPQEFFYKSGTHSLLSMDISLVCVCVCVVEYIYVEDREGHGVPSHSPPYSFETWSLTQMS